MPKGATELAKGMALALSRITIQCAVSTVNTLSKSGPYIQKQPTGGPRNAPGWAQKVPSIVKLSR